MHSQEGPVHIKKKPILKFKRKTHSQPNKVESALKEFNMDCLYFKKKIQKKKPQIEAFVGLRTRTEHCAKQLCYHYTIDHHCC
jgi:hypothetical protein